ncbi:hypothetical protein GGI35DRAFT_305209 [Trichoderma velutinum]
MAKSTKVKESKKAVAAEPVKAVAAKAAASKKVAKEEPSKKSKKKEPESSDESSEEEEDSDSASESESESESEEETAKKPAKKEAKKPAAKEESESESESDDSESDEEETKKPAVNGKAKAEESEDSDSESDSDEESDDEKPAAKKSKADSDDSEEDSDDSSDDDEEEEKAEPSKKRKADEEIDTSAKKTKLDSNAAPTLFAGSLAWSVDDDTLYQAFQSFDGLVGARVVTEKGTGRSRGFGYVDFKDAESAQVAYEAMQGQDVGGRNINLDYANARPEGADPQGRAADRAKKHGDTLSAESDTLFVGNLPFDTDQDSVTQFFNEVGAVTSVRLPTDPESGNLKGFGYVSFGSVEEAKAALEAKNGATIGHGRFARSVRLDFSSPRPQGGAGGRGGFGGGRGGPRGGGRGGRGGRGGFGGGRGGNFSAVNRTKPAGTKISFD